MDTYLLENRNCFSLFPKTKSFNMINCCLLWPWDSHHPNSCSGTFSIHWKLSLSAHIIIPLGFITTETDRKNTMIKYPHPYIVIQINHINFGGIRKCYCPQSNFCLLLLISTFLYYIHNLPLQPPIISALDPHKARNINDTGIEVILLEGQQFSNKRGIIVILIFVFFFRNKHQQKKFLTNKKI